MNVSSYIQSPNPSSLLVVHLIPLCFLNALRLLLAAASLIRRLVKLSISST
ncbi:unnamed protein product, partial [Brassica oleracea]